MNEMEQHQDEIKYNIENLINGNKLAEAEELLSEYEKLVKNDIEIYSIKAIICIMQNRLDDAENILIHGLNIEKDNPELLFNLAYVYENKGQYKKAYKYYSSAKHNSKDKNFKDNIDSIIGSFENKYSIKIEDEPDKNNVKTSIVILTYNKLEYTKQCIDSIRKYTEKEIYEIIIVDNNSTDETREWLKEQQDIKKILNDENLGFPGGCNVGINLAEKGNDILLLNNDVIVTPNWLSNLNKCLYSSDKIGAVGAVTNNCANYQAIKVDYKSLEDMIKFAEQHNQSDSTKWEQKVRLIGFCMLIRRRVLDKIGLLDEAFSPGNFEDDDLSYRIKKSGYKLYLCNDTFIHHYGSTSFKENPEKYNNLLRTNSQKFIDKWGFDSEVNSSVQMNMLQKFNINKSKFNVLHIGCGTGATLLKIKYIFNNANLFGIESNSIAAKFSSAFANVNICGIDEEFSFLEKYFDYILVSNSIEYSSYPQKSLERIGKLLRDDGKLFISIKNSNYYEEIIKTITGSVNLKENNLYKYYNYNEINNLFKNSIFSNITIQAQTSVMLEENEKVIDYICNLTGKEMKTQYSTMEYVVCCEKNSSIRKETEYILRRIENSIDRDENLELLYNHLREYNDVDVINDIVSTNIIKKEEVFNIIGLYAFNKNDYNTALKVLEYAYKYNSINNDTVYNIAYIIYKLGDKETALSYINTLNTTDVDILRLKKEILGDINE